MNHTKLVKIRHCWFKSSFFMNIWWTNMVLLPKQNILITIRGVISVPLSTKYLVCVVCETSDVSDDSFDKKRWWIILYRGEYLCHRETCSVQWIQWENIEDNKNSSSEVESLRNKVEVNLRKNQFCWQFKYFRSYTKEQK